MASRSKICRVQATNTTMSLLGPTDSAHCTRERERGREKGTEREGVCDGLGKCAAVQGGSRADCTGSSRGTLHANVEGSKSTGTLDLGVDYVTSSESQMSCPCKCKCIAQRPRRAPQLSLDGGVSVGWSSVPKHGARQSARVQTSCHCPATCVYDIPRR